VVIANRVLIPAILYRAKIVPFDKKILRKWDGMIATVVLKKSGMGSKGGRNYLYQPIEANGRGLVSLEAAAPAVYAEAQLSAGLNSKDLLTRAIAAARLNLISAVVSKAANKRATAPSERWQLKHNACACPSARALAEQRESALAANPTLTEGARRSILLARTVDGETLRPDILDDSNPDACLLSLSGLEPGETVEAWSDGSYRADLSKGAAAAHFTGGHQVLAPMSDCSSSFEAELNGIYHAVVSPPRHCNVVVYLDGWSAACAVEAHLANPCRRAHKSSRTLWLLDRIASLVIARTRAGASMQLCFVYGHLVGEGAENTSKRDEKCGRWKPSMAL
jgi:hypothetical protein